MKHRDWVTRYVKHSGGKRMMVLIERRYCPYCHRYVRDIPNYLYRFKHYDRRIIDDVCAGIITSDSYGYEDYPCEMTMLRWKKSHKKPFLL